MKFYVIFVNYETLMQTVKRDFSLNKKLVKYLNGNDFK